MEYVSELRVGVKLQSPQTNEIYQLVEQCGKGSFGVVYKARSLNTQETVAVKLVDVSFSQDQIELILQEVNLTRKASETSLGRCPRLWEAFALKLNSKPRMKHIVVLVMEFIDGVTLSDILRYDKPFAETLGLYIVHEIAACLRLLHLAGFIHRDVKSPNILISRSGEVYVCDFGVAKLLGGGRNSTSTVSGTPLWMAPEVVQGNDYNESADVFSLGITAIEILTGTPPIPQGVIDSGDPHALLIDLRRHAGVDPHLDPTVISRQFRDLMSDCLNADPAKRITALQVVNRIRDMSTCSSRSMHAGSSGSITSDHQVLLMGSFNPKQALADSVKHYLHHRSRKH
jgi:serine/threonine-protein kinase 24/25/MST4